MKYSQARILLLLPYIGLWQLGYYEHINEYIVVLIALFPLLLLRKRDIRVDRTALFSILYGVIFIFLLLEPGFVYGKIDFSPFSYLLFPSLLYSLLLVVSLLSMIHGIVLKNLWKHPFSGMALTALSYIMTITPFSLFLDIGGLIQLILFDLTFIVVLSFYLGFLYLKSNLNILPGIIFLGLYTAFVSLGVSVLVSRLFNLVWEVIALSVMLFISDKTIREPATIKRIFKSKRRRIRKRDSSISVIAAGLIVMLILLVVLPAVTQESHYAIADPTDSMSPVIEPGSLLFVTHISPSSVKVGTIIVFNAPWENGTLFAHEVVGIYYDKGLEYFITKGVNNPAKDPLPVPVSDLVGHVSFSIPYLGYFLIYNQITAAVILVCAGIFYAVDVRR